MSGFAKGCGDGFGDEFCACGVGVNLVGEQTGFVRECGVEINHRCMEFLSHLLEGGDDLGLDHGFIDSPARFIHRDGEADVDHGF
jgi:hypothetical protein